MLHTIASILLWTGITLTVAGWIAFAWQAAKIMAVKDELVKFPDNKNEMMLRRNYCRLTIIIGILLPDCYCCLIYGQK